MEIIEKIHNKKREKALSFVLTTLDRKNLWQSFDDFKRAIRLRTLPIIIGFQQSEQRSKPLIGLTFDSCILPQSGHSQSYRIDSVATGRLYLLMKGIPV